MWPFRERALYTADDSYRNDPVRISVIGLGAMGQRNLEHIAASPNYRLVGVFDLNSSVAARTAADNSCRAYDVVEDCISDGKAEAIIVCTPHNLLAPYGLEVLRQGKHLLIEKPMAITVPDADALIDLAGQNNLALSVNYSYIFRDAVARARSLREQGAIGDLTGVEIRWSYYRSPGYYQGAHSPVPDDWRLSKEKAGGGMLIMTTCHALNYVVDIVGEQVCQAAAFTPPSTTGGDVEDSLQGILKFESGATGSITTSSSQRGSATNEVTFWGSKGTMVMGAGSVRYMSTLVIEGSRPGRWYEERFPASEAHLDRWLDETAAGIREGRPLRTDGLSARNTLAAIQALYESTGPATSTQVGIRR